MQSKWKYIALGALIGTAVSVTLAWPTLIPKAIADEVPMKVLTATKDELIELIGGKTEFFKPRWSVEDSVSTEVLSSSTIRKIEGGRTSFVQVARTATGVYSSDGLTSGHVRYPGIHDEGKQAATLAMLSSGGWMFFSPVFAGSSVEVVATEQGGVIVGGGSLCHVVDGNVYC